MKKFFFILAALCCAALLSAADLLSGIRAENLKATAGKFQTIRVNGKNALRISGTIPQRPAGKNGYIVGSITLPEPVSLEGKTLVIQLDAPDNPLGFYVRAYRKDAKKPVWSFMEWRNPLSLVKKLSLTAKRDGILRWEPAVISGSDAKEITRLEFHIGSNLHNTKQTITITGLDIVPEIPVEDDAEYRKPIPPAKLDAVIDLPKHSNLVENGKGNFIILHPDTAEGTIAANTIIAAVKKATGVTIPSRPGTTAHSVPKNSAIMLGNLISNPAMQVLYTRHQTIADEVIPGPKGYTIESIPEPFQRGADVVILGASDNDGLAAAAEAFAGLVAKYGKKGSLQIPHLFETHYTSKAISPDKTAPDHVEKGIATAYQRLKAGTHTSLGGQLAAIAGRYVQYRNSADARLYVQVAKIYAGNAKADPRKFGGAWGFDSDFPSCQAIAGWDLIEHDPALSDADRLLVSNMILRWMDEAIYAEAKGGLSGTGPCSNHLSFCSLGTMSAGFYFNKYYAERLPQSKIWLDTVRHNFKRAGGFGKVYDDCDGYQWLSWHHVLTYAMAYPDDTPFRNGALPTAIRVAGITMDNLGFQAPYGDTSGWTSSSSIMPVLRMYYAATRDPFAGYLLSRKKMGKQLPGSFGSILPELPVPDSLNGVVIHPLDPGYFRFLKSQGKNPPLQRCFDKFSFRETPDPASLYVLVDGINNGGHRHADANSVLRFTQFGREWLAENDYIKNQQKYHNSLLLLCDGESFSLPDYMEVKNQRQDDQSAAVSIRALAYGPSEWVRHYLWLKKDQAWLLIDEVTAAKDGKFRLIQRWNGVGDALMRPDGVELVQSGASMRLQTPNMHKITVTDDPELGKTWAGYPHASSAVVRVIDQTYEGELKSGECVRMAALWHGTAGDSAVPEWSLDGHSGEYRVNTGKNIYTITFDSGKLPIVRSVPSSGTVEPRKAAASADAGAIAPAPEVLHRSIRYADDKPICLTAPENRKLLQIRTSATETNGINVLLPATINSGRAATDGTCFDSGDSAMYLPDTPVMVDFHFDRPRSFTEAELYLWWSSTSSKGTAYQLKHAEVLAGDDVKSLRRIGFFDAANERHPDFGRPVRFQIPAKTAPVKMARVILTPRPGTAIYLGEVSLFGYPQADDKLDRAKSVLTRIIPVTKGKEKCYAIGSAEGTVSLISPDGKPVSEFRVPGAVNDLASYDLDNDGTDELLLACRDAYLRAVTLDGTEKWKVKFEFYRLYPDVTIVRTADLDGDGEKEILAGCDNWRTYAFDRNGKEIWCFEVIHPTRSVQPVDLDGDGKLEVICGTRYMWATVLTHNGLKRWGGRFGFGCRATAAPKTGNGALRNVVLGIDSGLVTFHNQKSGAEIARFLTGDEIFMMTEIPAANGAEDVLVASYNGYLYRFTASGKQLWNCALPGSVLLIRTLPNGNIAAGTVNGYLCILSPNGKIIKSLQCNGKIQDILPDGNTLITITASGELTLTRL